MATEEDLGDGHKADYYSDYLTSHGLRDGQPENEYELDDPMPFPRTRFPPDQVNALHANSDRDSSQLAQHHTLGPRHNQAAPGDHLHNGVSSPPLFWVFSGNGTTDAAGHLVIDTQAPFNTVSAAFIQFDQTLRSGGPMCTGVWYDQWTTTSHKIGSQWYNGTTVINAGTVYYRGVVFR